jgi:hypothetical protein
MSDEKKKKMSSEQGKIVLSVSSLAIGEIPSNHGELNDLVWKVFDMGVKFGRLEAADYVK